MFKMEQCEDIKSCGNGTTEKQYQKIHSVTNAKDFAGNVIQGRMEGAKYTLSQAREEYEELGEVIRQIEEIEK